MPVKKILRAKTPIHIWTDNIEREAEMQLERLAALPFLFHHVAVMPDVHAGRGSTIGTVIATKGALIPAAVGVDIGCGMVAVQTNLEADSVIGKRVLLRNKIERSIPLGFDQNKQVRPHIREMDLWERWDDLAAPVSKDERLHKKALAQLGSLGGGNHFIEVCRDPESRIWILLHSGSRHIGKVLADVHIAAARKRMQEIHITLPDRDLSYLTDDAPEFHSYVHDLRWAQAYAMENREEMIRRVTEVFDEVFSGKASFLKKINCHHNYAGQEEHYKQQVWVTRKGAVSAKKGEPGIIPGSMGAKSFIVQGLGNAESFHSCAHGAGRRMSRAQAKRQFSRDDLARETDGVECRKDGGVLDEIPSAYKDINAVMEDSSDLVEVVTELKQLLCVKG